MGKYRKKKISGNNIDVDNKCLTDERH